MVKGKEIGRRRYDAGMVIKRWRWRGDGREYYK